MIKTEDVFGVSNQRVLSYIERPEVDVLFQKALNSDKQIIVYGASKQGKTSLVSSYLPYAKHIVIRLSANTSLVDIYSTFLRAIGIQIKESEVRERERGAEASLASKVKAMIPFLGEAEVKGKGTLSSSETNTVNYREISINLELPNDVAELAKIVDNRKFVILENFHYLDEETQKAFARDLRNFQELGIRFVILGVWREKDRLLQFNGDLLDRYKEIPVEPWTQDEFKLVITQGAKELNVNFADHIIKKAIDGSFSSIGVFQELIKETCLLSGVTQRQEYLQPIENENYFDKAVSIKAGEYVARHQKALEAIAAGNIDSGTKDGVQPLYLPYYLVKVILELGFDGIANGMTKAVLQEEIRQRHHRGDDVRSSDMGNLLSGLAALQERKNIYPPIIDYDTAIRKIQVVDSTFYFFLRNTNLQHLINELPNPLDA